MGGKKKDAEVKYIGPSKEEIAQRQLEYDKQIALLQEQNKGVQQSYDTMRMDSERALGERTTLMQQEAELQRKAYDEVLGTTKQSLAQSQQIQAQQASLMNDAAAKQEQQGKLQSAQADKEVTLAKEQQDLNRRNTQRMVIQGNTRKKRRGIMSTRPFSGTKYTAQGYVDK